MIGKVCEDGGWSESAMLDGMEWARPRAAQVVNMSLGGTDSPDVDPIEAAVNRLPPRTGALFVVSAGNAGPGNGTIGSPGSADAALTVGDVDQQDRVRDVLQPGPRVGDRRSSRT